MRKHEIPTPEKIKQEWLEQSELYATAKTLRDNAVAPTHRYQDKLEQALRQSDFWLDLYIDLGYLSVKNTESVV